jgi:hypothetical protein
MLITTFQECCDFAHDDDNTQTFVVAGGAAGRQPLHIIL